MALPPFHDCRVLGSPRPGVYARAIASGRHYGRHSHGTASGRHYGRHSHGTYGFGVVDAGAHRSASGSVDAFAGDIVTAGVAITRPAFADADLQRALRDLLHALERWQRGQADALGCEEALVAAGGLLVPRHTTRAAAVREVDVELPGVQQCLADHLQDPPTLGELAAMAGISRFQLLRRFAAVHGCTPHAWLVQQRAERARGWIRRGGTLADAAAEPASWTRAT